MVKVKEFFEFPYVRTQKNVVRELNDREIFWLDVLKRYLTQNEKGQFVWVVNPIKGTGSNMITIGKVAGGVNKGNGYIRIKFQGNVISGHQLSFLNAHGYIPKCIDHINHIRADNRPDNLRDVTQAENTQNLKGARSDSKTGVLGVSSEKRKGIFTGKYRAEIKINGKRIYLGLFATIELATAARKAAELKYFTHAPSNREAA